jgi:hypothetical protein
MEAGPRRTLEVGCVSFFTHVLVQGRLPGRSKRNLSWMAQARENTTSFVRLLACGVHHNRVAPAKISSQPHAPVLVHHSGSLYGVSFLILAHSDVKHVAKGALARGYLSGVTTHDLSPQPSDPLFVSKAGELVHLRHRVNVLSGSRLV